MPPPLLYDPKNFDFSNPLHDIEAIRDIIPQRGAMEQLTAIVHIDRENHGIVGYRDITDDEFWVAGHMPGFPLMPGIVMCECAAQLASFYSQKYKMLGGDFVGFGGMDQVRFRGTVHPKCRLILMARMKELRPNRRAIFQFQGVVDDRMVFDGDMTGVPIFRNSPVSS